MHPAGRSGRHGARWGEEEEEEEKEKEDRSIIQLMHFPLFVEGCKPDR